MTAFDRQEAIQRMCRLQAEVATRVIGHDSAADCFCGESGFHPLSNPDDYRNEFKAIEFIERAVEEAIAQTEAAKQIVVIVP